MIDELEARLAASPNSGRFGNRTMIGLLTEAGHDLRAKDGNGETPLIHATAPGNDEAASMPLDAGAELWP